MKLVLGNTTATKSAKLSNSLVVAQASSATTELTTLRQGSTGSQVKELQTKLKQLRYYNGPVNGVYGKQTEIAVASFQKAVGLTGDGVANTETWQWLQALQPKQPNPTANQTLPNLNLTPAANQTRPLQNLTPAGTTNKAQQPTPAGTTTEALQPTPVGTTNPQSATAKTDSLPRWVWLLLGSVVTIAGVGGGIYLFLRLFGYEPFEEEDPPETRISQRQPPRAKRVDPYTRKPQPESRNNGYKPAKVPISETRRLEAKSKNQTPTRRLEAEPKNQTSTRRLEAEPKKQTSAEALPVEQTTRLPKINIVDELINDLRHPDRSKRQKAIWDLAQRGDSRALQPLLDLMIDSDSKQRSLILEALSQIGTRTLKPMNRALAISLQDENAEVRKNAIRDLTRIYELISQINQLLLHATNDPDAEVQETAEWALKQLNRIHSASGVDNSRNFPTSGNSSNNSSSEPRR